MRASAILVVVLGLASALAGIVIAAVAFEPIPFADSLDFYRRFFEVGGWSGYGFNELYARHNEHRLVIPRLWYLLDLGLFDATQASLIVVTVLSSIAHAAILAWVFRSLGHRGPMLWTYAAAAFGATLSPAQWENLVWSFQIPFVQVWLFASLAFVAIAGAGAGAGAGRGRAGRRVAVAIAAGLASTYSMANGILVWPLLIVLALWCGVRGAPLWLLLTAALTVIGIELAGYHAHPGHGDPMQTIRQPIAVARYALRYLTSGVAIIGNPAQEMLGGGLVAAWAVLSVHALLRRDRHAPAHGVFVVTAGFAVGAAVLTGLGRVPFGIDQANSVRYATPSFVFMLSLFGLLLDSLARIERERLRTAGAAVAGAGLLVPGLVFGACHLSEILDQRDIRANAIVVYLASGNRPETLGAIYPYVGTAYLMLEQLDRRDLGPFADRRRYRLPQETREADLSTVAETCRGHVDLAKYRDDDGLQIAGWLAAADSPAQPAWVVVTDRTGGIFAWGASLTPRPDVGKAIGRGALGRGFHVFGPPPAVGPLHVPGPLHVFGVFDRRICRLPGEVPAARLQAEG